MPFYPKQPCCVLTTHCKISPVKVFCFKPLPSKAKSKRNFIKHLDVVATESAIQLPGQSPFLSILNPECMVVSRYLKAQTTSVLTMFSIKKRENYYLQENDAVCQNNSNTGVEDRDLLLSQTGPRKMCVENVLRMAEVVIGIWCMPSAYSLLCVTPTVSSSSHKDHFVHPNTLSFSFFSLETTV